MTFYSGDLTGNGTPVPTLVAALDADITSVTGWSLVESYNTGTWTYNVYKCASATSGMITDFHVIIGSKNSSPTEIRIQVSEGYNATTHKVIRPMMVGTTAAYYTTGSDCTMGSTEYSIMSGTNCYQEIPVTTSTTRWELIVHNDALILTVKTSYVYSSYCGSFTSHVYTPATNDPMPLTHCIGSAQNSSTAGVARFGTTSGGSVGFTRQALNPSTSFPSMSALSSNGLNAYLQDWHKNISSGSTATSTGTWDKYSSATPKVIVEPINMVGYSRIYAAEYGWLRGKMNYVVMGATGATFGDMLTIGSDTYHVCYFASTSNSNLTANTWVKE